MFWCRDFKGSVNPLLFASVCTPRKPSACGAPQKTHLNSCLMENCESSTAKFFNMIGAGVEKVRKFQNEGCFGSLN